MLQSSSDLSHPLSSEDEVDESPEQLPLLLFVSSLEELADEPPHPEEEDVCSSLELSLSTVDVSPPHAPELVT